MLRDLILKNRTRRRFFEGEQVSLETLRELVDLARLSASGANKQPLKYMLACTPERNARVFPNLAWAGYLPEWGGPPEGERPAGYIILLCDTAISPDPGLDPGIAAQSIMLGAVERGLGGCIIASINRDGLRRALDIPAQYNILLVLALGKPREEVVIDPVGPDSDIRYWRDATGKHHVPKRALEDVIID
ncbi:MAG: nitroreductase family protein [Anaerolineae bacterium]|nr:nitroreductase family protein [Anaerolineae bacterium]